jgi:Fibronectin type III domain
VATPTQIRRRGRWSLVLGTLFAAVALGTVALADTVVVNDVVTHGNTTGVRGASGTAEIYLQVTNGTPPGDPNGCNAATNAPVRVTLTANAGGTLDAPSYVDVTTCDDPPGGTIEGLQMLGYSVQATAALGSLITFTGTGTGGKSRPAGTSNLFQADTFTVRVLPRPASNLDATANGQTQIDLTWTASADAADIDDYRIYEGASEVATAAKNATSASITGLSAGSSHCYTVKARVNIGGTDYFSSASNSDCATTASPPADSSPPVITRTITGTAGSNGWYRSDVSVAWSVSDPESAVVVDSGCGTQNFTSNTAGILSACSAHSAGGSASDSVTIKIDKTKPLITASATANGSPYTAGTWTKYDVVVTFSCADVGAVQSGIATNTVAGATLAGEGADQSVANTGSCVDEAGNPADPASFGDIDIDKTKPEITATATKADSSAYTAGSWTNQDVTVGFACSDALSGVATDTVAGGGGQTTETSGATFNSTGSCVDEAGNAAEPASFGPVKIDKTRPVISASATANGVAYTAGTWTKYSVVVDFSCADAGRVQSGLDVNTVDDVTVAGEGADQTATNGGTCKDNAGNTANPNTYANIDIDKSPPTVEVTGVTDNATYTLGAVPAAGCTTTDQPGLSGVKTSAALSLTGGTVNGVGTFTAACNGAEDNAGNVASKSVKYYVAYAGMSGILQPINPDNTSVFNRGKAVPVKFRLAGDEPNGFNYSNWKLQRQQVGCTSFDTVDAVQEPIVENPSNGFRYDAGADQYIYNANFSDKAAGTCWKVIVTLDSNQVLESAIFKLQK